MLFRSTARFHGALLDAVHGRLGERQTRYYFRGGCGTKMHDLDRWPEPAAKLINARALALFQHAFDSESGVVDIAWANVYREGDYCMAHSHTRALASIVYMLDPGDAPTDDAESARLCFVDPRLACCCSEEDDCMTTPFCPEMPAGTMIMFPGKTVHTVTPYHGTQPRVTLSWNINRTALAGSPLPEHEGD